MKLVYQLETIGNVSYENPQPVEDERELFRVHLENGLLTVELKTPLQKGHCAISFM